MVFSSLLFLFYFLPIVLVAYYLAPKAWRNPLLFFVSLFFYAWGEPVYVLLMLFTTAAGWAAGLLLRRWEKDRVKARAALILASAVNLALLGFFKYGGLVLESVAALSGRPPTAWTLPLPLGISFYTFQTMSYVIDVYRGQAPTQPNFLSFGAYVALFPQLIAGPIVRYNTIAEQLIRRRENLALLGRGAGLFVVGLAKKVLLANNIGLFWDQIRALPAGEMTWLAAWSGIIGFGLQLYFDFSGYSDMAVGLGRMFGFYFEPNFQYPYISRSVTEFWRRWHISLGTWFREYLYIPLGGSRGGQAQTLRNLLIVWAATGLWHGASWNYLFWGLYYFLFLAGEKSLWGRWLARKPGWLGHAYTLLVVMTGWTLFVFEDTGDLLRFAGALVGLAPAGLDPSGLGAASLGAAGLGGAISLANDTILYALSSFGGVLLAAILAATPLPAALWARLTAKWPKQSACLRPALLLFGLLLSVAYLVDSSYNPFLYFRF
ncbi:MAG: MBOAT family protein [Peptococcaceae bacterium]|nr:MBOAT family protein [Peptococcaceae bacterium]